MRDPYVTICGGTSLEGEIRVQGSKNTALPVMAACLLTCGRTILYDCPRITDVVTMVSIMEQIGCKVSWAGNKMILDTSGVLDSNIPKGKAGTFRGSSLLMGALLGRNGKVTLEEPGGCRIGKRPLNYHFLGFEKMGISVEEKEYGYDCSCDKIKGAVIDLPYPSVGATENIMLAAARAEGITIIRGCAREPEICDLAAFLIHMGVKIDGAGTSIIKITGKRKLNASHYRLPYDRIAAATYLLGSMMTKGDTTLFLHGDFKRLAGTLNLLEQMGASVYKGEGRLRVKMEQPLQGVRAETGPYPGIPTDIQPLVLAATLQASQPSLIIENVFDARFQVCKELEKMGGKIRIENNCAIIFPVRQLRGAEVYAMDLRGGAALVLAALAAKGETKVHSFSYVERGYENFVEKLASLGAQITLEK